MELVVGGGMEGVVEAGLEGEGAVLALLVEGEEADLRGFEVGAALLELVEDAFHGLLAGGLGLVALAHELHHQVRTHYADDFFAMAGGSSSPHLVVDEQAGADDGGVADPPVHFISHAAGGAGAAEIAGSVEGKHADGVVVFDVDNGLVPAGLEPLAPFGFGGRGEQVLAGEALGQGKLQRPFAHQHHVWGFFHHGPGQGNGVFDMLEASHRPDVGVLIHDAGVEGHAPLAVGAPAVAHRALVGVGFHQAHAFFHRIEGGTTAAQHFPSGSIGLDAEAPGANHHWCEGRGGGAELGERLQRFERKGGGGE